MVPNLEELQTTSISLKKSYIFTSAKRLSVDHTPHTRNYGRSDLDLCARNNRPIMRISCKKWRKFKNFIPMSFKSQGHVKGFFFYCSLHVSHHPMNLFHPNKLLTKSGYYATSTWGSSQKNDQNYGQTTLCGCITIMHHFGLLVGAMYILHKNAYSLVPQPSYSPKLALLHFWIFLKHKRSFWRH